MKKLLLLSLVIIGSFAVSLRAQVVISQPTSTHNGSFGNQGQSFTPNLPTNAGFTNSSAYLTEFTFVVSADGAITLPTTPTYLLIYTSYAGGVAGTLLDTSLNTQTWSTIGGGGTATFEFSGQVALDINTKYYAVFSESPTSVVNPTHDLKINFNDPYLGGVLLHQGNELPPWDAVFSATFQTSAVPEPATYAAIAGVSVLGLVGWRRRTRR